MPCLSKFADCYTNYYKFWITIVPGFPLAHEWPLEGGEDLVLVLLMIRPIPSTQIDGALPCSCVHTSLASPTGRYFFFPRNSRGASLSLYSKEHSLVLKQILK